MSIPVPLDDPTQNAVRWALRLALPGDLAGMLGTSVDWVTVLRVAQSERMATLAWTRNAATIREHAPSAVVSAWRHVAVRDHEIAVRQLEVLGSVVTLFRSSGLAPVVLRGIPLSSRLYGEPYARACADLDLYVDEARLPEAASVLAQNGWTADPGGRAPWEIRFFREKQGSIVYLELHGSLLDQNHAHLRLPSAATRECVVASHTFEIPGAIEPALLAVHMAKHMPDPLLWSVDFHVLWSRLSTEGRDAAAALARQAGIHRYLGWAVRRAQLVVDASQGSAAALQAFGYRGGERRVVVHAVWRDVALAASPGGALRAIGNWAWPAEERSVRGAMMRRWIHRLRRGVFPYFARREKVPPPGRRPA